MTRRERHRDPTWPYEDIEEPEDIGSEPTWTCAAGFCLCPDAHELRAEPAKFSIVLCGDTAEPMPGARCRVLASPAPRMRSGRGGPVQRHRCEQSEAKARLVSRM